MASRSSPIDIATPSRNGSASPRHYQTSNLTSALHSTTGNGSRPTPAVNIGGGNGNGKAFGGGDFGQRDSTNRGMAAFDLPPGGGVQPISLENSNRDKPRRESLAGSLVGGMSWGGMSVGSWIRDDIIMQGTSPFAYQSPSYHSSSYLPKLEANFMRDFSCCELTLASLHELLQHYEEHHTQQIPPTLPKQSSAQMGAPPDNKAAIAAGAAAGAQERARQELQQIDPASTQQTPTASQRSSPKAASRSRQQYVGGDFAPLPAPPMQDMDGVQDMEMDDDVITPPGIPQQEQYALQDQPRLMQRSQFGQPASSRVPPLNLSSLAMGNPMQTHQGLRNSQPTTPISAGRTGGMFQNNPTVSSVNTPTLSAHPLHQQQYLNTPDSSAPGTPAELDTDFVGNLGNMSMGNQQRFMQNQYHGFDNYGFGNGNEIPVDLCIDEPAKRLFSLNGGYNNPQQTSSSKLGDDQYGENSEIARTIREQQRIAGVPEASPDGGVPKPFHCPVIGCEKAYKNQNGLKYHKSHGHNTQQLAANDNGTFSIVDPETLSPYPGTLGMEKHKPYRCDVCGKRYKNLNGLKYHKNHSPACDTEQKPEPSPILELPNGNGGGLQRGNIPGFSTGGGGIARVGEATVR